MKETPLRIKIIQCSGSFFWYTDLIGEILDVEYVDDNYWCRELNEFHALNFVLKKDAVLLNDSIN